MDQNKERPTEGSQAGPVVNKKEPFPSVGTKKIHRRAFLGRVIATGVGVAGLAFGLSRRERGANPIFSGQPESNATKTQGGKSIELTGNWKEYFTPISAEEAKSLLIETDGSKFLFPLDASMAPNLRADEILVGDETGERTLLGIKNIPEGTFVYSQASGSLIISANEQTKGIGVQDTMKNYGVGVSMAVEPGEQIYHILGAPIEIGKPLVKVISQRGVPGYPDEYQVVTSFWRDPAGLDASGSISNLLRAKGGKIAFINQQNQS